MCSYIVEKAALYGSAKGANGWMGVDTANVYYDHPFHSPLDHALMIDFVNEKEGAKERVAVELSAESALALVDKILAALKHGEAEHGGVHPVGHKPSRRPVKFEVLLANP
jgi:hypothetical protein